MQGVNLAVFECRPFDYFFEKKKVNVYNAVERCVMTLLYFWKISLSFLLTNEL